MKCLTGPDVAPGPQFSLPWARSDMKEEAAVRIGCGIASSNINGVRGIPGSEARPQYNYKQ